MRCFAMSDRRGSDVAEPILILRRLSRRLPLTLLVSQVDLPDRLVHLDETARQSSQVTRGRIRGAHRGRETTTERHHHVPIVPMLRRVQDAHRGRGGRLASLHGAKFPRGTHRHPLGKKWWGEMPLYPRGCEKAGWEGIPPCPGVSGGYSTRFLCRLSVGFWLAGCVCVSVAVAFCRFLFSGCIFGR
nr:MAG TPA: hypothetical protein [Caudoviricetes sp.]